MADKRREAWFVLNVGDSLKRGKLAIEFCQREENEERRVRQDQAVEPPPPGARCRSPIRRTGGCCSCCWATMPRADATTTSYYYGSSYYVGPDVTRAARLSPAMYEQMLPRLCGTGRFVWLLDSRLPFEEGRRLTWDDGPPWQFRLRLEPDEARQQLAAGRPAAPRRADGAAERRRVAAGPRRGAVPGHGWPGWTPRTISPGSRPCGKSPTIEVPYRGPGRVAAAAVVAAAACRELELPDNLQLEQVRLEPQGKLSVKSPERYANVNTLLRRHRLRVRRPGGRAAGCRRRPGGSGAAARAGAFAPEASRPCSRQLAAEGLRPLAALLPRERPPAVPQTPPAGTGPAN